MAALFPSYVITVLELFRKHGFEAYVVGGAVRDLLCGKHPHDYDIVTSARPEETRRLCKGAGLSVVENLGENFGVLVLLVHGIAGKGLCLQVELERMRTALAVLRTARPWKKTWHEGTLRSMPWRWILRGT